MNKIQKLYRLGNAKWYDIFKPIWNWMVSRKAEKKLARFLKDNLNEDIEILELGCGTALNLEKIQKLNLPFKHYHGLDFSEDMLKIARAKFSQENVSFKHQDLSKLDNHEKKADVILCTWVLSHLPHPATIISNAQKLLKKDGQMFLIFLSEPKWFIRFWFNPIAKYIFKSKYISNEIIGQFENVRLVKHYSANLVSVTVVCD